MNCTWRAKVTDSRTRESWWSTSIRGRQRKPDLNNSGMWIQPTYFTHNYTIIFITLRILTPILYFFSPNGKCLLFLWSKIKVYFIEMILWLSKHFNNELEKIYVLLLLYVPFTGYLTPVCIYTCFISTPVHFNTCVFQWPGRVQETEGPRGT